MRKNAFYDMVNELSDEMEECFLYYGRSRGDSIGVDARVYFAATDEVNPGDIVKVEILDCDEYDLTGKVLEE